MNERARRIIGRVPGARAARDATLGRHNPRSSIDVASLNQQLQVSLIAQYRNQFSTGARPFDSIRDAGFRCYSQFEEDGIILYVLAAIGMTTRRVVEIGCGNGREGMATNLVINHGYEGFLFDGSQANIQSAHQFFSSQPDCLGAVPTLAHHWITRENVNDVLERAGAIGEVDLFSLDLDGNDWHIWNAIDIIKPRLCVFETHDIIPGDLSLTIPYEPDFDAWSKPEPTHDFRSASLLAMKRLSEAKGYRLIGAHRHGFNVFFLRNDISQDLFPEASIAEIHDNPWTRSGQAQRWPRVQDLPWLTV